MIDPVRRDGVDARRVRFERDGFLSAVPILAAAEAQVYTILTSPLHHGWTLHASGPNHGAERRIGFNARETMSAADP